MSSLIGWKYRKKINITGQSGAGTNYQLLLKVGESAGSSGADFNLGGLSAKFPSDKNDGGDLRFTLSDGIVLLDFWVEEVSGTAPNRVAKIWVKVLDDLGTNKSIYCYFGNISAYNYSNGDRTFLFFDDFDGDLSNWDTGNFVEENNGPFAYQVSVGYNTPYISNGNLIFDGIRSSTDAATEDGVNSGWWGRSVKSKNGIVENNFIVESRIWFTQSSSGGYANQFSPMTLGVGADKDNYIYGYQSYNNNIYLNREVTGTRASSAGIAHLFENSTWKNIKFTFINNGTCEYKIDSDYQSYSAGQSLSTRKVVLAFDHRAPSASVTQKVDYVFARKYAATEPVFGSAEREETLVSPRRIIFINASSSSSSLSFSATLSEYPLQM